MKLLQLVLIFALTALTSVHGRTIHRLRRSSYFANETACVVDDVPYYNGDPVPSSDPCEECKCRTPGFVCTIKDCEEKDGCQRIKVPGECCSYKCDESAREAVSQEDVRSVPVSTTLLPEVSSLSDVKEKDQEQVPRGEEGHLHSVREEEHLEQPKLERHHHDSDAIRADEPKSEVITTARPSEAPVVLEDKKEQEQEVPVEQDQPKEEPKPIKRSEPAVIPDSSSQESTSVESLPASTEEPRSTTRQDSDKKLEAVTEAKKEGRSGTDEPQSEGTSPAPEKEAVSPSQQPEESSKDELKDEEGQKDDAHIPSPSEKPLEESIVIGKRDYPEEDQLPAKEHIEAQQPVSTVSSSPGDSEGELTKSPLPAALPSEELKDDKIEVRVVSSTPQADKQEVSEIVVGVSEDEKKGKEKKEVDGGFEEKQQDASTSQLPPRGDQEVQTTVAPSVSPSEEAKEVEKEIAPPAKSGPSKRFADWIDYVPRDFQA